MSNERNAKKLLEELIRRTVAEALIMEQGGDVMSSTAYKAFIEPFTDIVATAAHGVERISARVIGETALLAKQLAFLFMPFFDPDAGSLKNMTSQERQKIASKLSSIDGEFKNVLDRNWTIFNDPDVWGTLFLLNPQAAISAKLVSKAPEVALELLQVFTGGSEAVSSVLQGYRNLKTGGGRVVASSHHGSFDNSSSGYGDYAGDLGGDYAGVFQEQTQAQPPPIAAPQQPQPQTNPETWLRSQLSGLLRRPDIQQSINNSKLTRAMQGQGVQHIVQAAQKDLSFSFEDLKRRLGPNYQKALASIQGNEKEEVMKELESNSELQKKIVTDMKALLKPAYVRQLQSLLNINPKARQVVAQAIQKVNAL